MTSGSSNKPAGALLTFVICLGLAVVTAAAYGRVGSFSFLNYDDIFIFFRSSPVHEGLTWANIVWGATTCYYEYWHPLMWWSHMLDCQLFGMNAGPHHLVSLGFHVANTLLVFAVLQRMTGMVWRSAVVAALFGLHPLHVESVAWLAERKDLLSTFFSLLCLWAYARYVEESREPHAGLENSADEIRNQETKSKVRSIKRPMRYYWLALSFFLLGLLSKPMVVTLPFVLLLLDYWPFHRIPDFRFRISDLKNGGRRNSCAWLAREKWPFFGLTVLFCFITWYSVKLGNNFPDIHVAPLSTRLTNIPISYVRYLCKAICPVNLAVLYPMPDQWAWWKVAGSVMILLAISWLVFRARTAGYLVFGWLAFLGVLVPTIGIVQVGEQAMADRYMYLPLMGLLVAAVWGAADLLGRWKAGRVVGIGLTVPLLGVCGWMCWIQVQYWHDSVSLWKHCIAAGAESLTAYHDLGHALVSLGESDKAMEAFQAALRLAPNDRLANLTYGGALVAIGKPREATNYFAKTLNSDPNYGEAHENMGLALLDLDDVDGAIYHFGEAIRLDPTREAAYTDMGRALSAKGKSDEAASCYTTALNLNPAYAEGYFYLGLEYLKQGALDAAVSNLEKAVQFDPTTLSHHLQLADVYVRRHERGKAISEYQAALRLSPNLPGTLNNLAWLFATAPDAQLRNGAEAVRLAKMACEGTSWRQTVVIGTLAAAYAEAGDFDKAVETAQKACDLASASGEKELLEKNQELLSQYKNRQPFREKD